MPGGSGSGSGGASCGGGGSDAGGGGNRQPKRRMRAVGWPQTTSDKPVRVCIGCTRLAVAGSASSGGSWPTPCELVEAARAQIYGDRRRTQQAMADAGVGAGRRRGRGRLLHHVIASTHSTPTPCGVRSPQTMELYSPAMRASAPGPWSCTSRNLDVSEEPRRRTARREGPQELGTFSTPLHLLAPPARSSALGGCRSPR